MGDNTTRAGRLSIGINYQVVPGGCPVCLGLQTRSRGTLCGSTFIRTRLKLAARVALDLVSTRTSSHAESAFCKASLGRWRKAKSARLRRRSLHEKARQRRFDQDAWASWGAMYCASTRKSLERATHTKHAVSEQENVTAGAGLSC